MLAKGVGELRLAVQPPPERQYGGKGVGRNGGGGQCALEQVPEANASKWAQARANEEGSRDNLTQACANEVTSRAIHFLIQRTPSKGTTDGA